MVLEPVDPALHSVRYRRPDGTIGTENGFDTRPAARKRAAQIDAGLTDPTTPAAHRTSEPDEQPDTRPAPAHTEPPHLARPTARPTTGDTMTLGEWVTLWAASQRLSPNTAAKYASHLRQHILPAFAQSPLDQITRIAVKTWAVTLANTLSSASVSSIVTLLSTILNEAAANGLIAANPCQRLRLPKQNRQEKVHATALQILQIAARLDPGPALLVITAAYTGMRWGELTGLAWDNVLLDEQIPALRIDPQHGALHEIGGRLWLDGPKTIASVRTVAIPAFLAAMLTAARRTARADYVFTSEHGGWLRRSNFRQRTWDPAVNGDPADRDPARRTPIAPAMTFHGLRHTHKTWIIEDGIREFVQDQRLGHYSPGIGARYSHVTPTMTHELVTKLETRYQHSLHTYTAKPHTQRDAA